jgi:uncharacterized membrane protein
VARDRREVALTGTSESVILDSMKHLLTTALTSLGLFSSVSAEVNFVRDVQPIIAEKCTLCHGPDDKKGGLRLTSIDFASAKLKSGHRAIVPGDTAASHLLERIHSDDPDEIMPPPDKAEPLTDKEKKILQQWIDQGADWPKHWGLP